MPPRFAQWRQCSQVQVHLLLAALVFFATSAQRCTWVPSLSNVAITRSMVSTQVFPVFEATVTMSPGSGFCPVTRAPQSPFLNFAGVARFIPSLPFSLPWQRLSASWSPLEGSGLGWGSVLSRGPGP